MRCSSDLRKRVINFVKAGGSLEAVMDTIAYLGCAAASVVIGKDESYLTSGDHKSILNQLIPFSFQKVSVSMESNTVF